MITSSQVTTPTDPTFLDPDLDAASQPFTVSGTAAGTGAVDIFCVIDNGNAAADGATPLANDVPVAGGGGFGATIDLQDFNNFICRLIAVDSADTLPFDINAFRGPVVGNAGHELRVVGGGPNDGLIQDYYQQAPTLGGYWSSESAGNCFVYESFPIDPASLRYAGALWACSFLEQGEAPTEPSLRIDSHNAHLPNDADEDLAGFRGIESLTQGIDPANGRMRSSDTEPAVICVPDDASCTSYADSGVTVEQKQTGGTGGNTLTINHHWVNTTKSTKQLEVFYGIQGADGSPGWRFPGESAYSAHTTDDTITPPQTGPASFFLANDPGSTCPSLDDPCGSLTWYEPPAVDPLQRPLRRLPRLHALDPAGRDRGDRAHLLAGLPAERRRRLRRRGRGRLRHDVLVREAEAEHEEGQGDTRGQGPGRG